MDKPQSRQCCLLQPSDPGPAGLHLVIEPSRSGAKTFKLLGELRSPKSPTIFWTHGSKVHIRKRETRRFPSLLALSNY